MRSHPLIPAQAGIQPLICTSLGFRGGRAERYVTSMDHTGRSRADMIARNKYMPSKVISTRTMKTLPP